MGTGVAAAEFAALARTSSGRGNSSLGFPMQETNSKMMDHFGRAEEILTAPSA